jgi:hypothetical protein
MNDSIAIPEADEDHTVRLTPAEFAATWAKIDKMNARFAKRGFTGRFELTGERVEETKTNALGFEVTEVFYTSPGSRASPEVQRLDLPGPRRHRRRLLHASPPPPASTTSTATWSAPATATTAATTGTQEHLPGRSEDGEVKNVGSTCIKDFLGWDGNVVFFSEATSSARSASALAAARGAHLQRRHRPRLRLRRDPAPSAGSAKGDGRSTAPRRAAHPRRRSPDQEGRGRSAPPAGLRRRGHRQGRHRPRVDPLRRVQAALSTYVDNLKAVTGAGDGGLGARSASWPAPRRPTSATWRPQPSARHVRPSGPLRSWPRPRQRPPAPSWARSRTRSSSGARARLRPRHPAPGLRELLQGRAQHRPELI